MSEFDIVRRCVREALVPHDIAQDIYEALDRIHDALSAAHRKNDHLRAALAAIADASPQSWDWYQGKARAALRSK